MHTQHKKRLTLPVLRLIAMPQPIVFTVMQNLFLSAIMTLRLVALSRSQVSFVDLPHAACTPYVFQWPNSGWMSFHISGSRLHFDNCTFNGPTVAMKASPPEPPTVVSDADQPQATEAPPNSTVEKRFVYDVLNYQHPVHDLYQHPEATNNPPESMPTPKAMPAALVARELARQDRDRSFLVARGLAALEANSHPPASNVPADVQARILAQLDRDRARLAYASPKAGSISPGRCGTCQTCTDSNCAQPPSRPPSSEKSCATESTEWMHPGHPGHHPGRGSSSNSN
jgi:hypothetical protein